METTVHGKKQVYNQRPQTPDSLVCQSYPHGLVAAKAHQTKDKNSISERFKQSPEYAFELQEKEIPLTDLKAHFFQVVFAIETIKSNSIQKAET